MFPPDERSVTESIMREGSSTGEARREAARATTGASAGLGAGRSAVPGAIACVILGVVFSFGGCHGEPTKSQYVSAVVRQECGGMRGMPAQACRVGVIKRFADVPLSEMQAQYPPPEPPVRPSCSLW